MYDVNETVVKTTTYLPFILLAVALVIVLAFEFVNGFYDTAYALATVVYTHSMSPSVAVLWFGFFNFLGVLLSSGAVASGIISLLPVELILQVGSDSGFAMTMIGAADIYGLTVSTTLVLSSGVAGTMAANRSGCKCLRYTAYPWHGC